MHSETKIHNDAIDREKAAYKETLDQLSALKGEIESIQQKLEKGNLKLQSDFDIWYRFVVDDKENRMDNTDETIQPVASKQGSKEGMLTPRIDVSTSSSTVANDPKQTNRVLPQQSATAETQNEFKLPDGIKLTGNPEADADIIAFYKAKEVLMSKMKRK